MIICCNVRVSIKASYWPSAATCKTSYCHRLFSMLTSLCVSPFTPLSGHSYPVHHQQVLNGKSYWNPCSVSYPHTCRWHPHICHWEIVHKNLAWYITSHLIKTLKIHTRYTGKDFSVWYDSLRPTHPMIHEEISKVLFRSEKFSYKSKHNHYY